MIVAAVLLAAITLAVYACVAEARVQQANDNAARLARLAEIERSRRIATELDLNEARLRLARGARR